MKHQTNSSSIQFRRAVTAAAFALALGLTTSTLAQSGSGGSRGSGGTAGGAGATGTGAASDQSQSSPGTGSQSQAGGSGIAGSRPSTTTAGTSASPADKETRTFIKKAAKHGLVETRLSQLAVERTTNESVRTFAETVVRDHQHANARLAAISNRRGIMIPAYDAVASTNTTSGTAAGKMAMDDADRSDTDSSVTPGTSRSTVGGQSGSQAPAGGSASARSSTSASAVYGSAGDSGMSEVMEGADEKVTELSEKTGEEFDRAYVKHMIKGHKESIALYEDATKRNADAELSGYAQTNLPTLRAHLNRAEALERELKE